MNDNNYILDSNAPPQIRGIPFQGSKLKAQSSKLKAQGSRLKDPGFFRNAGSAPVVAIEQPSVRGRPLTKLRDGPEQCMNDRMRECLPDDVIQVGVNGSRGFQPRQYAVFSLQKKSTWLITHSSKHGWDWNAPPDRTISNCHLDEEQGEIFFHRDCFQMDGMRFLSRELGIGMTEEMIWLSDKIRGNPFALRDTKSLTGGRLMIDVLND